MMDQLDAKSGGDAPQARLFPGVPAASHPVIFEDIPDRYKMNNTDRGVAIIINNRCFDPSTRMPERVGTDVDLNDMHAMLKMLGFEKIRVHTDASVRQIASAVRKAANEDYTNSDCFVCVILTHGEEGYIWGTDNKIAIDDLVGPFKGDRCKSLAGKPKIFFIQACRGSKLDVGVTEDDAIGEMESEEVEQRRIPTEADFLLAYSVVPGFYSWRNSANGSWFIQALKDVFAKYSQDLDLLTLMTRVCKKVAYDYESNARSQFMSRKKQIPCITSMLTKDVYFFPK